MRLIENHIFSFRAFQIRDKQGGILIIGLQNRKNLGIKPQNPKRRETPPHPPGGVLKTKREILTVGFIYFAPVFLPSSASLQVFSFRLVPLAPFDALEPKNIMKIKTELFNPLGL